MYTLSSSMLNVLQPETSSLALNFESYTLLLLNVLTYKMPYWNWELILPGFQPT